MRVRWLLVLVLILLLVAPTLTLFQSPPPSFYQTGGSGTSVLVVAKEDFVYARVLVTIQPDGVNQSVSVTFPNGTSTTIQEGAARTETFVLPNTIYYTFRDVATSGEGYSVSGGQPLDVVVLTGQNATEFLTFDDATVPIQGIHVFYFAINGAAMVSTRVLGASL
ncbi:MAG: hypothetical protein ABSF83_11180 [Nitrososphaerales archaeon]|jgi:hypothetical protein